MCKITRHTRYTFLEGKSMKVGRFGAFCLYEKSIGYKVGDVVCFQGNHEARFCHRIVLIEEIDNKMFFTMKGDNNEKSEFYEIRVPRENIEGKVIWSIPKL